MKNRTLAVIGSCLIATVAWWSSVHAFWHGQAPGAFSQPALAAAAEYNHNAPCETSASTSTIDLNNTLASGFNWYVNGVFPRCRRIGGSLS
jgi:hypothetical protein